jgi:3-phenylpropionate/trans-cinnamate dioxygenase ferredoxin component
MSYQKYSEIPEGFEKVCSLTDLSERKGKRFFVNDTDVALFKVDGEVFALGNVCPHQHSSVIYDGFLDEDYIVCPSHGWKFNLKTGRQPTGYKGLDTYEVIVSDNTIYVKAAKKELKW